MNICIISNDHFDSFLDYIGTNCADYVNELLDNLKVKPNDPLNCQFFRAFSAFVLRSTKTFSISCLTVCQKGNY